MHLTRVTASLLACFALAAPAVTQGKPFKHALPANTLAFVTVPDLNTSLAEFQATPLAKMWRESEVQDFVADAMKMGQAKWAEGVAKLRQMNQAGMFPVSPDDLLKLRLNGFSAALTSLRLQMTESKPQPKIGLLVHADFGASAATWRKLAMVGVQALMAQAQGKVKMTESKLDGDVELITLVPPTTEMSLNIAFVGNGVVIGTITEEVTACVNAITGQKTILPTASTYKATSRYLDGAGAELEAYLHVAGVVDFVIDALKLAEKNAPNWPPQLQVAGLERALSELGLRSVQALGLTSKYEGSKSVTRGFMLAPEEARRGLFSKKSARLEFDFLNWVPADVASLSASRLDIASIYDGLIAAVKAYNPEQAEQLLAMLKAQEEQVGISLEKDLFGVFGDQMVWWSMGVQNFMSAPEGAMLLRVKDQDRLLATLNKVAQMSGGVVEFPSSERKGIKTWRLELNPDAVDAQIAGALSFLQPCFAFKNGYMVMALATGDVRKAMKRMDRTADADAKGDVRSNKEFASYLASMQQHAVSSFDWTDWKVSFENLYSAATSVLAFAVSADEVPFDLTLLPEAETLSQHLFSSATWSTTNKDGYVSTHQSPIGPEVLIGLGALALGGSAMMVGQTTVRRGVAPATAVDRAQPARPAPPAQKGEKKAGKQAGKKEIK